jgi:hypothetical protein
MLPILLQSIGQHLGGLSLPSLAGPNWQEGILSSSGAVRLNDSINTTRMTCQERRVKIAGSPPPQ